ncbi:hypothetical protein [Bacillus sp. AK031]
MNKTLMTKLKKFLAFILIASIFAGVSYLVVFKISFLPNGYDIVEVQNESIKVKSFTMLGIEEEIKTISFSEKEIWKVDAIEHEVNRQKEFLWSLFSFFSISVFLLVYKIRNEMKLWKAILESNIVFSVLLPLPTVTSSLKSIQVLIN